MGLMEYRTHESSFVGPDPDQKLLAGSGSRKNHSGSEMNLKQNFSEKLEKQKCSIKNF
jgi:hypothetical protein